MSAATNFGMPKIQDPSPRTSAFPSLSQAGGYTAKDIADRIGEDLIALQREDIAQDRLTRDSKEVRLQKAYAHGLVLRSNEEAREHFFAASHWRLYEGHRPKVGRHGREDAMRFAVMRAFADSEEARKAASMWAKACWLLAHYQVPAEDFLRELRTRRTRAGVGCRALADEATRMLREIRAGITELCSPEAPSRPKMQQATVTLPSGIAANALPTLFLIEAGGELKLSLSPVVLAAVSIP